MRKGKQGVTRIIYFATGTRRRSIASWRYGFANLRTVRVITPTVSIQSQCTQDAWQRQAAGKQYPRAQRRGGIDADESPGYGLGVDATGFAKIALSIGTFTCTESNVTETSCVPLTCRVLNGILMPLTVRKSLVKFCEGTSPCAV